MLPWDQRQPVHEKPYMRRGERISPSRRELVDYAKEGAMNPTTRSSIRRAPTTDARLAEAVRRLHELGPRLVCELEYEIEELREQLQVLREVASTPPEGRAAELVGLLKTA